MSKLDFNRYIILNADGTPVSDGKYFVLRYDALYGALGQAARIALIRFCDLVGSPLTDKLLEDVQNEQKQL